MQWTPFDVKIMEHQRSVARANQFGWLLDPPPSAKPDTEPTSVPPHPRRLERLMHTLVYLMQLRHAKTPG